MMSHYKKKETSHQANSGSVLFLDTGFISIYQHIVQCIPHRDMKRQDKQRYQKLNEISTEDEESEGSLHSPVDANNCNSSPKENETAKWESHLSKSRNCQPRTDLTEESDVDSDLSTDVSGFEDVTESSTYSEEVKGKNLSSSTLTLCSSDSTEVRTSEVERATGELETDCSRESSNTDSVHSLSSSISSLNNAPLFKQKLDLIENIKVNPETMLKLQNVFQEYERSMQKAKSHNNSLKHKVNQLKEERAELKSTRKEVNKQQQRKQQELESDVQNLQLELKVEQEKVLDSTMRYKATMDKLMRTEKQQELEVQERHKMEFTLRSLQLEFRQLANKTQQLEFSHSQTQKLLAQERVLREEVVADLQREQNQVEALQSEASEREEKLLQQNSSLQKQISNLKTNLEDLQVKSSAKERGLMDQNEILKGELEDAHRDLRMNSDILKQTVSDCHEKMTALKSELNAKLAKELQAHETLEAELDSVRTGLAGATQETERWVAVHTEVEKALLQEKKKHQSLQDRFTEEASNQMVAAERMSQKLAKAEARANSMENEVDQMKMQLTDKDELLNVLQRDKDQLAAHVKELETSLQAREELVSHQKPTEKQFAQSQIAGVKLTQRVEELEREKEELNMEMEKLTKKAKKILRLKKNSDLLLDEEQKRTEELQKEINRLKTIEKLSKKKLHIQDKGAVNLGRHSQDEGHMQMEEMMEWKKQVTQDMREAQETHRQELQRKLEQVNIFLQTQLALQEEKSQIKMANLQSQMEQRIQKLQHELEQSQVAKQNMLKQTGFMFTEREQNYRQKCTEDRNFREDLNFKLEKASHQLAVANSKFGNKYSTPLITGSFAHGGCAGPSNLM